MGTDAGNDCWSKGKGSLVMNKNCRFNIADARSASNAVICHAIIQPKRRPFRVSVAGNTLGLAISPHTFERGIGFQAKLSNDTEK
jgi:hypothetical protein